jgi:dGTPase
MDMFLPFFDNGKDYNSRAYLEQKLSRINDDNQKVQYIRARWIGLMIGKLATLFMSHEQELLTGTLENDLLKCLTPEDHILIDRINQFSVRHIYNYRAVVEIEIAGYNVIGGLLKEFIHAVLFPSETKSAKIIKLVSSQFPIIANGKNIYADIQSVVDFIAGMTDLYAIDLYRKITGITIPEIR